MHFFFVSTSLNCRLEMTHESNVRPYHYEIRKIQNITSPYAREGKIKEDEQVLPAYNVFLVGSTPTDVGPFEICFVLDNSAARVTSQKSQKFCISFLGRLEAALVGGVSTLLGETFLLRYFLPLSFPTPF